MDIKDYEISLNNLNNYNNIIDTLMNEEPISLDNFISTYNILFTIKNDLFHMYTYTKLKFKLNNTKVNKKEFNNVDIVINKFIKLINHINYLLTKKYSLNNVIKKLSNKDMIPYFKDIYNHKKTINDDINEIYEYNNKLKNNFMSKKEFDDNQLFNVLSEYVKDTEILARDCNYKYYRDLVLDEDNISKNTINLMVDTYNSNKELFYRVSKIKCNDKIVIDKNDCRSYISSSLKNVFGDQYFYKVIYLLDNCTVFNNKNNEVIGWINLMPKLLIDYKNDISSLSITSNFIGLGIYLYYQNNNDIFNYNSNEIIYNTVGYLNQIIVLNNLCNNDKLSKIASYELINFYNDNFIDVINSLAYEDGIHNNINNLNINYIKKDKNYKRYIYNIFNDYKYYKKVLSIIIATKIYKDIINNNYSYDDYLKLLEFSSNDSIKEVLGIDLTDDYIISYLLIDTVNYISELINKK